MVLVLKIFIKLRKNEFDTCATDMLLVTHAFEIVADFSHRIGVVT